MPLSIIKAGRRVRVISVDEGREFQSRMAAMGLLPGVEIIVLQNSKHGPFLIEVKGSRIMLGHAMAQKIKVG